MYNSIRGIKALGHLLKRILPRSLFRLILKMYHKLLAIFETPLSWYAFWCIRRSLVRIQRLDRPIRFGFYVVLSSMFQWRRVFELMMKDERFSPFIVVAPRIGWQPGDMEETAEKTYASLAKEFGKEYVFKGYHDGIFDNHIERCDACAMMNLYSGLAEKRFEAMHFALHGIPVFGSCYFYDPGTVHSDEYYGMRSLKFVRKFFCSNEMEKARFIKCQKIHGDADRVEVSGCPKTDEIACNNSDNSTKRKTILLAPHHSVVPTIDSGLCLGNFLRYKDWFLSLPATYPDIDWIFRPHPHLKLNLVKNLGWTDEQWRDYVTAFTASSNAVYEEDGPYYESFRKSDALLHDCCSFLSEYFYTGKPQCYMLASEKAKHAQFGEHGGEVINHTYQAYSQDDIIRFIEEVVINGHDPMKAERQKFGYENIIVNYPHASEFIVDSLAKMLGCNKKGKE